MRDAVTDVTQPTHVAVIVVTYNSATVIEDALCQLVGVLDGGGEVIVVDNCSTDDSVARARQVDPRIVVLALDDNYGFAVGVNRGLALARSGYVCLLNPDAAVTSEALVRLAGWLLEDPTMGAIAPLVVQGEGYSGNSGAYRFPTIWRTFSTLWGVSLISGPGWLEGTTLLTRQIRVRRDVDWLTGACVVMPTDFLREVGGLTERWFMYGEDIDLGLRIARGGKRVVVDPSVVVHHRVGGSSEKRRSALEAAWLVNQWQFYRSDLAPRHSYAEVWRIVAVLGVGGRAVLHLASGVLRRKPDAKSRGKWLWRCGVALARER